MALQNFLLEQRLLRDETYRPIIEGANQKPI
jgi:hypothetical protein